MADLKKFVSQYFIAILYVICHTLILFYQVVTLNVAINSHNNALLTLLVSNQFVEIKGSVFKKFQKDNLFHLSCSDIVERFQISIYLMIITLRNLLELGAYWPFKWSDFVPSFEIFSSKASIISSIYGLFSVTLDIDSYRNIFDALLYPIIVIVGSEMLVDWIKHAFITKFNNIQPRAYQAFFNLITEDIAKDKNSKSIPVGSRTENIASRIGFAVIPLSCLVIRILWQSLTRKFLSQCSFAPMKVFESSVEFFCWIKFSIFVIAGILLVLFVKLSLSALITGFAESRHPTVKTHVANTQAGKSSPKVSLVSANITKKSDTFKAVASFQLQRRRSLPGGLGGKK